MKLLIAVDMEGITGVVQWDQVTSSHPDYQRFRRLMTQDVNAAIQGAAEAGVDEIVVSDGHWNSNNILIEELDPRARLNCGTPAPLSMVQGVDDGVDAAFFIGYHARIGSTNAILDHTWSSARVCNLWLNERLVGEIGLNGSLCGWFGVPVLLVSGDQTACAEARDWLPGVEAVQVKKATGRFAAECLPPAVSQAAIRAGARRAVEQFKAGQGPAPLSVSTPVKVCVELFNSDMADRAALLPGSKRDARRITFEAGDMPAAYSAFRAAVTLAA